MNKVTTSDRKFFKGIILVKIHDKLTSDKTYMSIEELETFLKHYADVPDISIAHKDFTHEMMQILKEFSKQFANSIGLEIKDKKGEPDNDDLDFNRTDKN